MLKKILYIGLGVSIIVVKTSIAYLLEKKAQFDDQPSADLTTEETVSPADGDVTVSVADDLTEISGIGPTYANRLKEAGISTYAALANMSPEEVRQITKATGKSADVESWIMQAKSLA